jgi:hypothetical protein
MRRASVPQPSAPRMPARPAAAGSGRSTPRINYTQPPQPQRLSAPPPQQQQQYFGGGSSLRPDTGKRLDDSSRRKSFLGLLGGGNGSKQGKLAKKQSSMF